MKDSKMAPFLQSLKERHNAQSLASGKRRVARFMSLKDEPCVDCGESFLAFVMDFDHVRGIKKFPITRNYIQKRSKDTILKEMAKCDLVCANCHRARTHGDGSYYKNLPIRLVKQKDPRTKQCYRCGEVKSLSDFCRNRSKLDGRASECKMCVTAGKHQIRDQIRAIKESTPCADCRKNYPFYVMDFDHRDDKLFNIGRRLNCGTKNILEEIKKCDIVCANCHRVRTRNEAINNA